MFHDFSEDDYNRVTGGYENFSDMEPDIDATASMSDDEIDARELEAMMNENS